MNVESIKYIIMEIHLDSEDMYEKITYGDTPEYGLIASLERINNYQYHTISISRTKWNNFCKKLVVLTPDLPQEENPLWRLTVYLENETIIYQGKDIDLPIYRKLDTLVGNYAYFVIMGDYQKEMMNFYDHENGKKDVIENESIKKITIISSTLRQNGSSYQLAKSFIEGAKSDKNDIQMILLKDLNYGFCHGCLACQETGRCILKDDIDTKLLERISSSDVLVFASPVYFYSISGALKTFLDRLNPIFIKKNNFKKVFFLATCADEDKDKKVIEGPLKAIQGFVSCFNNVTIKGWLLASNINTPDTIKDTEYLRQAYILGKQLR